MNTYKRHRFLSDIISCAVWLYYRFNLSNRRCAGSFRSTVSSIIYGGEPRKVVTDTLRSYGVAHRELMPDVIHSTEQYENNRVEQSHEATRVRERGMRQLKSTGQAQRFLGVHAAVYNLFNLGRHLVRDQHYRDLRISAFNEWSRVDALDQGLDFLGSEKLTCQNQKEAIIPTIFQQLSPNYYIVRSPSQCHLAA